MTQEKILINLTHCSLQDLSEADQELVNRAREATANSYAKYSRFRVGAAVRLRDGSIFIGANQENAAFPSGLCAERTAIFAAQANRPDQPILQLAIAAADDGGLRRQPVSPCGACRQVILEIEERYHQPIEIFLTGLDDIIRVKSVRDLLPLCFVDSDMR
jgi:cytidine deaminase